MEYQDKLARFNFILDKVINFGIANYQIGYGDESAQEQAALNLNEIMKFLSEELL